MATASSDDRKGLPTVQTPISPERPSCLFCGAWSDFSTNRLICCLLGSEDAKNAIVAKIGHSNIVRTGSGNHLLGPFQACGQSRYVSVQETAGHSLETMVFVGSAPYNMGSVKSVSGETACPCDFPAGYRLNGVQARSRLGKIGMGVATNVAFGLACSPVRARMRCLISLPGHRLPAAAAVLRPRLRSGFLTARRVNRCDESVSGPSNRAPEQDALRTRHLDEAASPREGGAGCADHAGFEGRTLRRSGLW